MRLKDKSIILTGAYGGIGNEMARLILEADARIALVGRDDKKLNNLMSELALSKDGVEGKIIAIAADVSLEADRQKIIDQTLTAFGNIDILINLAGSMSFNEFSQEDPKITEELFQVNALAPMQLTKMVIPHMVERGSGQIVNIGSIFGSISFAWFATYSATKFALRGFSEALRRELDGTGVTVNYIAPRAVRTPFNSDSMTQMCDQLKTKMDSPTNVAKDIVSSIQDDTKEKYLGFPEKIFVRINALFPRLIDRALKSQNQAAKKFINKNRNK